MAWVESHQDIGQHPKTTALATALNADLATAVGVLHLLWHFTLKFSWRTGNLKKYPIEAIAGALGWHGKADEVIKALQKTGWLNGLRVHDWHDYAGRIVHDRLYNEKRRKTETNGDNLRKTLATVPDPTVPNQTLPKDKRTAGTRGALKPIFSKPTPAEVTAYAKTIGFVLDGNLFCAHYESNGWRVGRNPMKSWRSAVVTWKHSEFRSEEKHGANVSAGIPGLDPEKIRAAGYPRHDTALRKVSSAGQILDRVRNLSAPEADRRQESSEQSRAKEPI